MTCLSGLNCNPVRFHQNLRTGGIKFIIGQTPDPLTHLIYSYSRRLNAAFSSARIIAKEGACRKAMPSCHRQPALARTRAVLARQRRQRLPGRRSRYSLGQRSQIMEKRKSSPSPPMSTLWGFLPDCAGVWQNMSTPLLPTPIGNTQLFAAASVNMSDVIWNRSSLATDQQN